MNLFFLFFIFSFAAFLESNVILPVRFIPSTAHTSSLIYDSNGDMKIFLLYFDIMDILGNQEGEYSMNLFLHFHRVAFAFYL